MAIISNLAVTGGPRSGKSTVLEAIKEEARDYKAIITPETATEFFGNGVDIAENGLDNLEFQKHVLLYQIERENRYNMLAESIRHPRVVRINDRGIMDGMAYINQEQFMRLLRKEAGLNVEEVFSRYAAVLHLESSAFLGDNYYIQKDNPVRQEEDPAEVRALDIRTRNSWVGHQRLIIVPASKDFDEKKARINKVLQRILADPHLEIERKFEIELPNFDAMERENIKVVPIFIEQIYLNSLNEGPRRIRKRGWDGYFTYYEAEKMHIKFGVKAENEKRINSQYYFQTRLSQRDEDYEIIHKIRHYFLWKNQYFELDIFLKPKRLEGMALLEIELIDEEDGVEIPPFIKVIKEVTGNNSFSTHSLAKKR